jgi:two-component system NtrC family response regulator
MEKAKLLIVEDDEAVRKQMKWALSKDYQVLLAEDRTSAMEIVRNEFPAVITLDLGLPPYPAEASEGFATLSEIAEYSHSKVIVITGRAEREYALRSISLGAYDYFYKPIIIDELKVVLQRAFYIYQLEEEQRNLQKKLTKEDSFEGMLGASPQIQAVFSVVRKVATTDVAILITGESGTGKELIARAIHQLSSRSDGPFVVINCGAIPENLLESELFGHEKGAFTGAHTQKRGRVEAAQGGTLFLDEIGELPLALQVKLLRFLQEQKFERVGGRKQISIDARVLAATNRDLKQSIAEGHFREDLYHRISVVTIYLPPLREREGDILLLANAFLQKFSLELKKKVAGFTQPALNALLSYPWTGNVRELENHIKRAVIMAEGRKISPVDLELNVPHTDHGNMTLKEAREKIEKTLIIEALALYKDNITKTSEKLGVSRPTLYELMDKLGISKK